MTITAISGCSSATASYTLDVVDPCATDTLTIDANKFAEPAATYDIKAPAVTFSWTDSNVSSDNSLTTCGAFTWAITLIDGTTAIDSSIFLEGDYNATTKTI